MPNKLNAKYKMHKKTLNIAKCIIFQLYGIYKRRIMSLNWILLCCGLVGSDLSQVWHCHRHPTHAPITIPCCWTDTLDCWHWNEIRIINRPQVKTILRPRPNWQSIPSWESRWYDVSNDLKDAPPLPPPPRPGQVSWYFVVKNGSKRVTN